MTPGKDQVDRKYDALPHTAAAIQEVANISEQAGFPKDAYAEPD